MLNCDYTNETDYCLLELTERTDSDYYYFGIALLKEYLVLCKYEDSSVSVYENGNRVVFGEQQKVIMIWVIFIILIGTCCLIGSAVANNKKFDKETIN